ncbi:hypothetical protein [Virgisporangium aliadipatigenens]|uniref:hypothetical protein n=1 Tax=Virgisporangium aliadipatigenens TaxID=741659 RepID=UPI00194563F4|nr:hypothetical protein [Virgisporangium aliadipatigenens]
MVVRAVVSIDLRRLLGVLGLGPTLDADVAEIAVLRHQLAVLQRSGRWPGRGTPRQTGCCHATGGRRSW